MPSGSMTIVRYPALFSGGTTLRKPKLEPNRPGIRTSGKPESAPEIVTASVSAAATEILSVCGASERDESLAASAIATRSKLTEPSPGDAAATSSQGACPYIANVFRTPAAYTLQGTTLRTRGSQVACAPTR